MAGFLNLRSSSWPGVRQLFGACLGGLLLAACGGTAPPDTDELRNFEYASDYLPAGRVRLTDGEWSQPVAPGSASRARVGLIRHATGDVSGDGIPDAAVVLVSEPGGSGTFYDLHVLITVPGGPPAAMPAVFLGDRLPVAALNIENGEIIVDIATRDPDDPFATTSGTERRWYSFEAGELRLARRRPLTGNEQARGPAEETHD